MYIIIYNYIHNILYLISYEIDSHAFSMGRVGLYFEI